MTDLRLGPRWDVVKRQAFSAYPGAPCRQASDTERRLWFGETASERQEAARRCRGCLVQESCRLVALANGERFGVWGGVDFSGPVRSRNRPRRGVSATNVPGEAPPVASRGRNGRSGTSGPFGPSGGSTGVPDPDGWHRRTWEAS